MYESDLTLFDEMGLIFYWSILLPILDAYTTFIILLMCSWISLSCFRVVSSGPMGAVTTPIPVSHLFQRHHHHHLSRQDNCKNLKIFDSEKKNL